MNDVVPLVQMKLPSANDVMPRINEVALRANGAEPLVSPSKRRDLEANTRNVSRFCKAKCRPRRQVKLPKVIF